MTKKGENDEHNPIALREVGILAGIFIAVVGTAASIGFPLLNSNIDTKFASLDTRIDDLNTSLNTRITGLDTSLNKRIDDLNTSLNKRIDDLIRLGSGPGGGGGGAGVSTPFPVAGKLPKEKLKEISKPTLLAAEPGEEVLMVPAGDYVVLPLQFKLGESATIEWQVIGAPKENLIDFYLLDEEGNVYRFSRADEYSFTWMSPTDAVFYLYFSNIFEPTKPKNLWVRLVESE
jgi:hypothetical protein